MCRPICMTKFSNVGSIMFAMHAICASFDALLQFIINFRCLDVVCTEAYHVMAHVERQLYGAQV